MARTPPRPGKYGTASSGRRSFGNAAKPAYDLFHVVLWGEKTEHASINVKNGQTVAVEGRMQYRQGKDPAGNDREVWELWADRPIDIIATAPDIEGFVRLATP